MTYLNFTVEWIAILLVALEMSSSKDSGALDVAALALLAWPPMHIQTYLKKHQMSQWDFAKLLGVSHGLVWQWINGETKITVDRAKQIESRTKGEISKSDLRPDIWERAA